MPSFVAIRDYAPVHHELFNVGTQRTLIFGPLLYLAGVAGGGGNVDAVFQERWPFCGTVTQCTNGLFTKSGGVHRGAHHLQRRRR
jgi:hypothetical protein